MAEIIMENTELSRYFKFNDDNTEATLVSMSSATGFGTEKMARDAVRKAAKNMVATRKKPPQWAKAATEAKEPALPSLFKTSARPTLSDLVGVFDAFYVRSSEGWLSRPHTRNTDGSLRWNESFAFAVPFSDPKAAKEAMSRRWAAGMSIIKSSNVFTEVVIDPEEAKAVDQTRSAIQSACSARDIVQELEAAARERMAAMAPAAEEPEKKRAPRL